MALWISLEKKLSLNILAEVVEYRDNLRDKPFTILNMGTGR